MNYRVSFHGFKQDFRFLVDFLGDVGDGLTMPFGRAAPVWCMLPAAHGWPRKRRMNTLASTGHGRSVAFTALVTSPVSSESELHCPVRSQVVLDTGKGPLPGRASLLIRPEQSPKPRVHSSLDRLRELLSVLP